MSMKECNDCHDRQGNALFGYKGDGRCSHCHGSGKETLPFTHIDVRDCGYCNGSGNCQTCYGSGEIEDYA